MVNVIARGCQKGRVGVKPVLSLRGLLRLTETDPVDVPHSSRGTDCQGHFDVYHF